ncbi:MAG TPA: methyltransferase domain-containing protein [Streptosporangiaceae bacterium]|jgi:cyclopropane fatty-acyl-phospholipid synthase-like methyltransferase|nr:methyltransferase domain-containing protein [Streptosporangiaceae bacterium]
MTSGTRGTDIRAERQALQAAAFDRIGARYDEAFPHKEGQLAAGEWLIDRLPPGSRVLDVGCGTGLPTARQLTEAGYEVTGIDISDGMLQLAGRDVPTATFRLLDVADLPTTSVGEGGYEAVVAFFSLLMLTRDEIPATLLTLRTLLTPGGYFLLSMVEADVDEMPLQFLGNRVWVSGYLRDELRQVVTDAGFDVLDVQVLSYAPATSTVPPEVQLFVYARRADG